MVITLSRETDGVLERAVRVDLGQLEVKVIALDDLANKRAAGRPQDLADVALLERVRAQASPSVAPQS